MIQAFKRHCELGYVGLSTGLSNIRMPGDIPYEEWDSWHSLVLTDELSRVVRTPVPPFGASTDSRRDILAFCGVLEGETVLAFLPL
jgi:hypothetical protein